MLLGTKIKHCLQHQLKEPVQPTCQYRLVYSEFVSPDTKKDVAERGGLEEVAQVFAQSTVGHLDGRAVGLPRHVDRVAHHAHLGTEVTRVTSGQWDDGLAQWLER